MNKAELQYNNIIDLQNPANSSSSLNIEATLKHFAEIINQIQEAINHSELDQDNKYKIN